MSDLDLFDRLTDLVTTHPVASLIAALLLGLAAPARLRRIARWGVVAAFWIIVLFYLVPVGVSWLALYVVGIRVVPSDDISRTSAPSSGSPSTADGGSGRARRYHQGVPTAVPLLMDQLHYSQTEAALIEIVARDPHVRDPPSGVTVRLRRDVVQQWGAFVGDDKSVPAGLGRHQTPDASRAAPSPRIAGRIPGWDEEELRGRPLPICNGPAPRGST